MAKRALIIPVHDEGKPGLAVLQSLYRQLERDDVMVIVVTGASGSLGQQLAHKLAERDSRVVAIDAPGAFPGKARNMGIKAVPDAAIIVQMDANCLVNENWLQNITAPIQEGRADYVTGAVVPYEGAGHLWGVVIDREAAFEAATRRRLRANGDIAGGCAAAYKRGLWQKSGGFPNSLRFGSDVVFASKIRALGPRIEYVENAKASWRLGPKFRSLLRAEYNYQRQLCSLLSSRRSPSFLVIACIALIAILSVIVIGPFWTLCALLFMALAYFAGQVTLSFRLYRSISRRPAGESAPLALLLMALLLGGVNCARLWGRLRGLLTRMLNAGKAQPSGPAPLMFLKRAVTRSRNFLHDKAALDIMVFGLKAAPPPLAENLTVRKFTEDDIALFAEEYKVSRGSLKERLDRHRGFVVELDGKAAACQWCADSSVHGAGRGKPFLFDIHPQPGSAYFFDALVLPKFRGMGLSAALVHNMLTVRDKNGYDRVYVIADAAEPHIGEILGRFGADKTGQLKFTKIMGFVRKDLQDLQQLCT